MNRKKQGSLSSKILKPKTDRTVSKQHTQITSIPKKTQPCLNINKTASLIQQYRTLKNDYMFNLCGGNIYEEIKVAQNNNDEEFCFDVDLGVPYVESQHLDSGFEFQEKQGQNVSFPKVSSAKQIFTSVLEINDQSRNELDEQNFTDQQEDGQDLIRSSNFAKNKLKSRKEVPDEVTDKQFKKKDRQQTCKNNTKKLKSGKNGVQNTFDDDLQKLNFMQKLKMTAEFREAKLKFWNQRLIQLQRSSLSNKSYSHLVSLNNSSILHDNSAKFVQINTQLQKEDKKKSNLSTKRSKFQKEPRHKNTLSNINIDISKNKQNFSPLKQRQQKKNVPDIKNKSSRLQLHKKPRLNTQNNQNENTFNSRTNLNKRREILLKNQSKSRSKDKNLKNKIF